MKNTLRYNYVLVLIILLIGCQKESATRSQIIDTPPIIKGFILRDSQGAFIKQLGTPNVKYIYDKNSFSSQQILIFPTFYNWGLPVHSTSIMFYNDVKQNITVTVVEGTIDKNLSSVLNVSSKVVKNKNFIIYQTQITEDQIKNDQVSINLSSVKKTGAYCIFLDFGDYVLYDNILIQ